MGLTVLSDGAQTQGVAAVEVALPDGATGEGLDAVGQRAVVFFLGAGGEVEEFGVGVLVGSEIGRVGDGDNHAPFAEQ